MPVGGLSIVNEEFKANNGYVSRLVAPRWSGVEWTVDLLTDASIVVNDSGYNSQARDGLSVVESQGRAGILLGYESACTLDSRRQRTPLVAFGSRHCFSHQSGLGVGIPDHSHIRCRCVRQASVDSR